MTSVRALRQIRRLVIILVVAGVVCAGTAAVVQSSAFTSAIARGPAGGPPGVGQERGGPRDGGGSPRAQASAPANAQGSQPAPEGRVNPGREGPGGDRATTNLRAGWPQVARSAAIMAALAAVVAFTLNVRQRQRRTAPTRATAIN